MSNVRFTHRIMVPNHQIQDGASEGYAEEMEDVKIFSLSQDEYESLRKKGSLFDLFDSAFGTIIDDCEEDRLSNDQVARAFEIAKRFSAREDLVSTSGLETVLRSLEYALEKGVFWEIVNGVELNE